jgi:hypothetical protein
MTQEVAMKASTSSNSKPAASKTKSGTQALEPLLSGELAHKQEISDLRTAIETGLRDSTVNQTSARQQDESLHCYLVSTEETHTTPEIVRN